MNVCRFENAIGRERMIFTSGSGLDMMSEATGTGGFVNEEHGDIGIVRDPYRDCNSKPIAQRTGLPY